MDAMILMFFNLSGSELLVIAAVAFLIFGPSKFPELGRKVGKFMREAKKVTRDITKEFEEESSLLKDEVKNIKTSITSVTDNINGKDSPSDTKK
jgi:Tat protein translocase TatB subunit